MLLLQSLLHRSCIPFQIEESQDKNSELKDVQSHVNTDTLELKIGDLNDMVTKLKTRLARTLMYLAIVFKVA